ncbi:MAG: DUF3426 domain-containing protein [Alphaproteobacteria bacterium]|nr:DUF3426 domain-containing protein [Alphaproteobacteria bacterium]
MKIKCDFCKTEYNIDGAPSTPVKCAVCGHEWTVALPPRRNVWLKFFASLCALFAAIIFTAVVLLTYHADPDKDKPLVASITEYKTATDDNGATHLVVSGKIVNQSDAIYAMPDLYIVLQDEKNNVVGRQKFLPTVTLLDAGAVAEFTHTLNIPPVSVKKISAILADGQNTGKK